MNMHIIDSLICGWVVASPHYPVTTSSAIPSGDDKLPILWLDDPYEGQGADGSPWDGRNGGISTEGLVEFEDLELSPEEHRIAMEVLAYKQSAAKISVPVEQVQRIRRDGAPMTTAVASATWTTPIPSASSLDPASVQTGWDGVDSVQRAGIQAVSGSERTRAVSSGDASYVAEWDGGVSMRKRMRNGERASNASLVALLHETPEMAAVDNPQVGDGSGVMLTAENFRVAMEILGRTPSAKVLAFVGEMQRIRHREYHTSWTTPNPAVGESVWI